MMHLQFIEFFILRQWQSNIIVGVQLGGGGFIGMEIKEIYTYFIKISNLIIKSWALKNYEIQSCKENSSSPPPKKIRK